MAATHSSPPSATELHAAALALLPAPVATRLRQVPELGSVLCEHFTASGRWRGAYGVEDRTFLKSLLRAVPESGELAELRRLHAADLALALGCDAGHPMALAEFERRVTPELRAALRRLDPTPAFVDEALQAARERLFLRVEGAPARIGTYGGTGPLAGWACVVAVRVGLNLRRGPAPQVPLDEQLAESLALEGPGPELGLLKHEYREAFRAAFRVALRTLAPRELNVLRLHFAGGLNIDRLGEMYGVHRATIARWLTRAREQLLEETHRELQARLRVDAAELRDVLELVRSQLVLTLTTSTDS